MDLSTFEQIIGFKFKNRDLLKRAFLHRSYLNEHKEVNLDHNERLEFLGDAVLELAVTDWLYHHYPDKQEGDLTAYRAALVNTNALAEAAVGLDLNGHLLLSRGEARDTGRARQYILADTFEAVVGAIYLDQGNEAAQTFIAKTIFAQAAETIRKNLSEDYKSRFQRQAQEVTGITPVYQLVSAEGPDHDKNFTVELLLGEEKISRGEGQSKQEAEQGAAKAGLAKKHWLVE
ncbi:MAG: ribonuclease III [Candidatus Vogelbacteria bacterium CG10_big_fil_rev_8_21_14_0_10_49_38]|uniref:Ribonuclease 3 n=1 Tax=Candidatus Vogelbacteria bacterium CG10_big_fil_rev_8_21_14_0_10_49_38 TaxID=1975043 RepID=A0A2H0RJ69_9BACT|nr:MAG: ribonuclease III [bacterium CG10_49_38]PIR46064.1 MAG: ribonuclease III [Candidatus Vogelbacteria bacterium CG10_big_fil_rev_8_21_14_0_10_49_38]